MNRIVQYTAVFTLLLYNFFYSSRSIVEIHLLVYRYFYWYFVGILTETQYFLLAFYRYFRETLDSVIFLRPRWQPGIYWCHRRSKGCSKILGLFRVLEFSFCPANAPQFDHFHGRGGVGRGWAAMVFCGVGRGGAIAVTAGIC